MSKPCKSPDCSSAHTIPTSMLPSIFNDVIGPVMRGPSSSHCAASVRIGRLARDLMKKNITSVLIEFDPLGSLATTHDGQGSDMGLFGGFIGFDVADEQLVNSEKLIKQHGIDTDIQIKPFGDTHPNTYRLTLTSPDTQHHLIALSTGGGMIQVISIDHIPVTIFGDYHETLIFGSSDALSTAQNICSNNPQIEDTTISSNKQHTLLNLKSRHPLDSSLLNQLREIDHITDIITLSPVLPILSHKQMDTPFITCNQLLEYNKDKNLALWELALEYESARGGITTNEVFERMRSLIRLLQNAVQDGLKGTEFHDRILGYQSGEFVKAQHNNQLLKADLLNTMIAYTTAIMEVKSSMGVIIAAPTAGACAALPAAVIAALDTHSFDEDTAIKGMLAAGIVGVFITAHASFAAEVGGCQAETGSAAGMAAAALTTMMNGSTKQATDAASMAIQNSLGLICDPVANRVEVPCLGKNVVAAANALASANMALANFNAVIPLDEVIESMKKVSQSMSCELKCTSKGGLAITPTSKAIELKLKETNAS